MDDLTHWLHAQLDEDERIAQAACWDEQSDVWTARPPQASYEQYTVEDYLGDGVVVVRPENADDDGVGQHVARHDPARVQREIDAKRRIMECHESWVADNGDTICGRCGREHVDGRPGGHFPCQTLRLIALPYADRPGYREEWRP
ncbi:DUF6221 family protein [Streptomyces sp900105755]|uniref:DUF6221 family protein n=1 Tax=Streptomyces sp. 900105755 TaxID=3154389 RepID=UPI003328B60C